MPKTLWCPPAGELSHFLCSANESASGLPFFKQKPTSSATRGQRLSLVQGLIDSVSSDFNKTNGLFDSYTITQNGNFMAAAANSELVANSTRNRNIVLDGINTYLSFATLGGSNSFGTANNDPPTWGIAAMNAYRAYGDNLALEHAIDMWSFTQPYFVTPDDVAAGKHPKKNIKLAQTCSGATTAGGIFYGSDPSDPSVNAETIGTWLSLSARLYEQIKDPKYQEAAELSAQFIQNHLYNGTIIEDTISLVDCSLTYPSLTLTYNSGYALDGYAVLASTNSSWTPFLNELVSSVIPFSTWTRGTSGINYEGSDNSTDVDRMWLKSVLMRALWETWYRGTNESAVNTYIESYLTVQWNALVDLASVNGTIYSSTWEGPKPTSKSAAAQMAVLDVLNAAVSFALPPSLSNGTSTSSSATSSQTGGSGSDNTVEHKKSHTGAIVGGVVGGVAFLAIVLVSLFFFCRRRKPQQAQHNGPDIMETPAAPYLVESSVTLSAATQFRNTDAPPEPVVSSVIYRPVAGSESRSPSNEKLSNVPTMLSPTSALASRLPQPRSPPLNETNSVAGLTTASGSEHVRSLPFIPDPARTQPEHDVQAVIANTPGLVDTINRLLQRLPAGGTHNHEPPPSYDS